MFKSYFEDYYVMTQKQWKFLGGNEDNEAPKPEILLLGKIEYM